MAEQKQASDLDSLLRDIVVMLADLHSATARLEVALTSVVLDVRQETKNEVLKDASQVIEGNFDKISKLIDTLADYYIANKKK